MNLSTQSPVLEFPLRRECPFYPPAEYARLREHDPVCRVGLPTGKQAWIVTRYSDVRALLADPTMSSDIQRPNFPAMGVGEQEAGARTRPFIRTDPPRHTRFRKMFVAEFTTRRVRALVPRLGELVQAHLAELTAQPAPVELVSHYANTVSTTVICTLLGVPADDVEFFRDVVRVSGGRSSTTEQVRNALGQLFELLDRLVEQKSAAPGDDLVSTLVTNHLQAGVVDRGELVSAIAMTIIAGRETTTSMIALGALYLMEHPQLRRELDQRPDRWPAAVDELLRVLSVGDSLPLRVATTDIELPGGRIPAGDGVIALLGAANHDPEVFPNPHRVDLDRVGPAHLAFGYGAHSCFGHSLARLEIEVALRELFHNIPEIRLNGSLDDVEFRHDSATFGIEKMLVEW